jgi:hypothetical protein
LIKKKILKEKYINHKIEIKWNLNDQSFEVECNEIYINNKLFGYYFHLLKLIERKEKRMTIKMSNNFSTKLLPKIKKNSFLKTKTVQKQSSIVSTYKNNFKLSGKFNIDENYIPDSEKKIFFFPESRNFIFLDEEKNSIMKNPIETYVKKNVLKTVYSRTSTKYTIKKMKKVNFSDESNQSSISSNSSNSDIIEEEENSSISNFAISFNDIYESKQNEIYDNLDEDYDDYYKINYNKVFLFLYDFENNAPVEIKNFDMKSQIEIVLDEEKNRNVKKILSNKQRRKSKLKNIGNKVIEQSPKNLFVIKTQQNKEKKKKEEKLKK